MKIDRSNKNKYLDIPGIYVHDDYCVAFQFDREQKILKLILEDFEAPHKTYEINFVGVVGFQSTSCDFWGYTLRIDGIETLNDSNYLLMPQLRKRQEIYCPNDPFAIDWENNHIEARIIFIFGDILTVACEYIEVPDDKIC